MEINVISRFNVGDIAFTLSPFQHKVDKVQITSVIFKESRHGKDGETKKGIFYNYSLIDTEGGWSGCGSDNEESKVFGSREELIQKLG